MGKNDVIDVVRRYKDKVVSLMGPATVYLYGSYSKGTAREDNQAHPVPLQAVRIQAGNGDGSADEVEGFKESGIGVITFHCRIKRPENSVSGNNEGVFIRPRHSDSGVPQRLKRQGEVGTALHRRDQADSADPGQERQGKEQTGDELAADAARNSVCPGCEPAFRQQAAVRSQQGQSLLPAEILIDRQGPGQKRRAALQAHGISGEQAERNHEAQSAAGFPAAQDGRTGFPRVAALDTAIGMRISYHLEKWTDLKCLQ